MKPGKSFSEGCFRFSDCRVASRSAGFCVDLQNRRGKYHNETQKNDWDKSKFLHFFD